MFDKLLNETKKLVNEDEHIPIKIMKVSPTDWMVAGSMKNPTFKSREKAIAYAKELEKETKNLNAPRPYKIVKIEDESVETDESKKEEVLLRGIESEEKAEGKQREKQFKNSKIEKDELNPGKFKLVKKEESQMELFDESQEQPSAVVVNKHQQNEKVNEADQETLNYRRDQLARLKLNPEYAPTIKISDNNVNSTNFMSITNREFLAIKNILENGVAEEATESIKEQELSPENQALIMELAGIQKKLKSLQAKIEELKGTKKEMGAPIIEALKELNLQNIRVGKILVSLYQGTTPASFNSVMKVVKEDLSPAVIKLLQETYENLSVKRDTELRIKSERVLEDFIKPIVSFLTGAYQKLIGGVSGALDKIEKLIGVKESIKESTEIWYMKPEMFRDLIMGSDWMKKKGIEVDSKNLEKTHIHLTTVDEPDPDNVYSMMQGEVWSPKGEARELIQSKGLKHTSMSVGDVMVIDGKALMVDNVGFLDLDTGSEVKERRQAVQCAQCGFWFDCDPDDPFDLCECPRCKEKQKKK